MKVIEAVERQPLSLPVSDVMDESGKFTFLPSVLSKGYFHINFNGQNLSLMAGRFVGQIPLTPEITINVRPKTSIANLARVIGIANQPINCLNYFKRKYQLDGSASHTLFEAMARSLLVSLQELDREGLYRQYIAKSARITGIRGRINIPTYIRSSIAKGQMTQINCNFYELKSDTSFNRVIKRAIYKLGNTLADEGTKDKKLVSELSYYAEFLDNVSLDESTTLLENVRLSLSNKNIPNLRQYYLDIIDISLIILEGSGIELSSVEGDRNMHSFIVNLEGAFEQYIRNVIAQSEALKAAGIPVLDGNSSGISTLFFDNATYESKPDLVIGIVNNAKLLGDVKYKSSLAETDRYQVISHASAYGVPIAFIISPSQASENSGATYIGSVNANAPLKFYHYKFNLNHPDLLTEENALRSWIESLAI